MKWSLRRAVTTDSESILDLLTTRQHLHPHAPLRDVMDVLIREIGCCEDALRRAVEWLGLDAGCAVGRLRRSELMQLAKAVHRYWRRSSAETMRR